MNIYQKLIAVQKSVKGLGKDSSAGFGASSYKYVSGSKVLDIIRPAMDEQGLLLVQEINDIQNERIDYMTSKGAKSELLSKVMMTFTWIDAETGETLSVPFGANGMNNWDKGLGSALTYAERYFLLKFFHIATDEDDVDALPFRGNEEPIKTQSQPQGKKTATDTQVSKAITRILAGEIDLYDKMKEEFNLSKAHSYALQDAVQDYKTNNNIM